MIVYSWSQLVGGVGSKWRYELVKNMFKVMCYFTCVTLMSIRPMPSFS